MPERFRWRRTSITTRLVVGYTLGCAVCLLLVGWLSNHTLRQRFERKHADLLANHLAEIRKTILDYPDDLHEAAELIIISASAHQTDAFFGKLTDTNGHVLACTPGFDGMLPDAGAFPPPLAADTSPADHRPSRLNVASGDLFLTSAVIRRAGGRPDLLYQVALNAGHVEEWLHSYNRLLGLFIALATSAAAVFGWLVAQGGLAPLRKITRSVQSVTAAGLHNRLNAETWPKELCSLATEFDRMLARLDDSFNRLSRFTADAAHEFRTPLNNLMGATSLILSRERTATEYREALENHLEQYHRLNRMLESLLFLARADGNSAPPDFKSIDAGRIARDIAEFFGPMAEEAGVDLTVSGGATLPSDESLLRMALTNLTANALRFTPAGGSIRIALAPSPDGGTVINVTDTGCGIAPEHLPHVFDRLYRADPSRSSGGAGLGLALVKAIMKLHRGSASATSTQEQGSTFRLDFPPAG